AAAVVAGAASALDADAVPALPLLVAAVASGAHAWALARPGSPAVRQGDAASPVTAPLADDGDAPLSSAEDGVVPDAGHGMDRVPTRPSSDPLRVLAASVAGVGAAAALPVTALMGGSAFLTFCAQLVTAALVAAALDVAARRMRDPAVATTARVASIAALFVAALAGLPAVAAGFGGVTAVLVVGLPAWAHGPLDDAVVVLGRSSVVADLPADVRAAALGLVAVWILAAVAALAGRRLSARRDLLAWTGAATVIAAIPALGPVAVVVGAYVIASAGALLWRLSSRVPRTAASGPAVVPAGPLVALSLAAGALAWSASWASTGTWWAATPLMVLLLVAGARTARTPVTSRLTTAGAAVMGLIAAAALAPSLAHARFIGAPPRTAALDAAADP
ncbi:hypothetical protein DZG02_15440, partial [Clavibacter lycopersici]